MTGGEYLFNLMAKSFGARGLPYHLQPVNVREVMENAYQDIRLKMFGAEGREWAANALIKAPGNVEHQNLRELNQRLKDENRRLTESKEALEIAVENRSTRIDPLLLRIEMPRQEPKANHSNVVGKEEVTGPITVIPKEPDIPALERREMPPPKAVDLGKVLKEHRAAERKSSRFVRFKKYMSGRAFE